MLLCCFHWKWRMFFHLLICNNKWINCSGPFHVKVYGSFIPRHIFYCFHAICAYLRCIFVALCVLFFWDSFDVVVTDQVSAIIPLLKIKRSMKVDKFSPSNTNWCMFNWNFIKKSLFADCFLLSFPRLVACQAYNSTQENISQANWHDWRSHHWYIVSYFLINRKLFYMVWISLIK